jgi:hypothetical protein
LYVKAGGTHSNYFPLNDQQIICHRLPLYAVSTSRTSNTNDSDVHDDYNDDHNDHENNKKQKNSMD